MFDFFYKKKKKIIMLSAAFVMGTLDVKLAITKTAKHLI